MTNIRLVVFDMDGTLLQPRSCWEHIHKHFKTDNSEMLQRYMEHKINDQEFAEADIKLWEKNSEKPVNEKYINSILDEIKPVTGAKELIDYLQNQGILTIILSGGIKYLANKWAKKWNIDEVIANDLIDDDRGQLCAIIESSGHAKGPIMDQLINRLNMSKSEVASVGDSIVDIPLFQRSSLSIAVNTEDEEVIKEANYHLKESNLSKLIPIINNW